MSYVVSARKWRTQTFDELIGQPSVSNALKNEIINMKIAHAYLFAGPRGIGKTSSARIFAKTLNCENGPTPVPCNICKNCVEITNSSSIDVLEIDGASNNGVQQVREVIDNVRYLPSKSRYKIYIIDEFHMLTTQAFNALLKTLEEPPAHAIFIAATTEPHKVIATIRSRMKVFNFIPIRISDIQKHLALILTSSKIEYEEKALYYIAKSADGALRDALSILDVITSISPEKIDSELVLKTLGLPKEEFYISFIENIKDEFADKVLTMIDGLINNGENLSLCASGLLEFFRHLAIIKRLESAPAELISLSKESRDRLLELSKYFTLKQLLEILNLLIDLNAELKRSINLRVTFENYVFKILRFRQFVDISELVEKLERLEKLYSVHGEIVKDIEKNKNSEKTGKQNQEIKEVIEEKGIKKNFLEITENFYSDFINAIPADRGKIKALLKNAKNVKTEEDKITLIFNDRFHYDEVFDAKSYLENEFQNIFNKKVEFFILQIKEETDKSHQRKKNIEKVKQIFDGKVINNE